MADQSDETYGLVMPFVTVQSKGGPHDDESYCAGYEMGRLDAILELTHHHSRSSNWTIRTENRAQADLIAMRYGYALTVLCDEFEGWLGICLIKMGDDA
ncbi:hypothetical protein NJB1604_35780 [Mycobacterium marinum]|uniref:hypothetical protein n=1 Tax=Mycobacterium marinum TaxID=1781 RepID=UPI0021C37345|nr:hypothetical protein [Mycobacterium marinum]GJO50181.1 hypothetical protein NJB1604_35780 [Mycobacterium marinum]